MLKPLDSGTTDSNIALLLDFPPKDAHRKGDLLSGRAGYTLHQLLNNAGIPINHCYITYCHDVADNKGLINSKGAFSEQGLKIKEEVLERHLVKKLLIGKTSFLNMLLFPKKIF